VARPAVRGELRLRTAQSAASADKSGEVAPVDAQRMWLTEDAYNRMKVEFANLLVKRLGYGIENGDPEACEPPSRDVTMVLS
jgi:hypothetical protein